MKPKYIRIAIFTLALATSGPVLAQEAAAPPFWSDKSGRVVQAKFIRLDGDSVIIEKDGKQFGIALSKLNADSVAQAKKFGGIAPVVAADAKPNVATFDPAGTDPIKPLWVVAKQDLLDPAAEGKKLSWQPPTALKSGDLVFPIGGGESGVPGQGAAFVDGKTGKVMWRTYLTDSPPDTTEWHRGCIEGPDGHIILGSVTFHGGKGEGALIHLRRLDRETGKVLTHMKMAVHDPSSPDEPKDVIWSGGQNDVDMVVRGEHIVFANEYFIAEIDMTQGKVLRSTLNKKEWQTMHTILVPGAACVFWYSEGQGVKAERVFARLGEEPRLLPAAKAGWTVVNAKLQRNESGLIDVICQSPDKQSWAAGAYDPMKDKWAWVKTDVELAARVAGKSKTLTMISFDRLNQDTKGPKYQGQWIVDASTGDLRHRSPGDSKMELLRDAKAWLIGESEFLLVNCADGKVEVRIPREAGLPGAWRMFFTPDGDVLSAAVKNGAVEITVMSAARKAAFPARKIVVGLSSPPKSVFHPIGMLTAVPMVLSIICTDGTEHYCAIPLPAK